MLNVNDERENIDEKNIYVQQFQTDGYLQKSFPLILLAWKFYNQPSKKEFCFMCFHYKNGKSYFLKLLYHSEEQETKMF